MPPRASATRRTPVTRRVVWAAIGVFVVFFLFLLVGYGVGADRAERDNRDGAGQAQADRQGIVERLRRRRGRAARLWPG